jgi:hypothetical protein
VVSPPPCPECGSHGDAVREASSLRVILAALLDVITPEQFAQVREKLRLRDQGLADRSSRPTSV